MKRIAPLALCLLLATPMWAATTVTWEGSGDAAYYVIERRGPNTPYPERAYDFVGPDKELYIDERPDPRFPCYRVTAVSHQGTRSAGVEFCGEQTP